MALWHCLVLTISIYTYIYIHIYIYNNTIKDAPGTRLAGRTRLAGVELETRLLGEAKGGGGRKGCDVARRVARWSLAGVA